LPAADTKTGKTLATGQFFLKQPALKRIYNKLPKVLKPHSLHNKHDATNIHFTSLKHYQFVT